MIHTQEKHEDMLLHKELLELLEIMLSCYRKNPTEYLAEQIENTYQLAMEYKHKIHTHKYPLERIPSSMV